MFHPLFTSLARLVFWLGRFVRGTVRSLPLSMATRDPPRAPWPPRAVSATAHATGLVLLAAALSWIPRITNPLHNGFGGSYQFLTIIALTMSAMTFALGLLADISLSKQVFALKNALSLCATPLEILVGTLYWSLYTADKKLVVPPGHQLPLVPDLGFHALPAILLTLEFMLVSPPWSIRASGALAIGSVMTLLYMSWLEYCFSRNGWYPYPGHKLLSTWDKIFLGVFSSASMAGCTMLLQWGHGQVNTLRRGVSGPSKTE